MKFFLFLLLPCAVAAQFKYDNVLYKTIDWETFCKQYPSDQNALVLDVRSREEYEDTADNTTLNIGHLKNALHINVNDLGGQLNKIELYKNNPVYVYCSHSQRSRRSAKMLADSGFTNVININGGLTDLYFTTLDCKPALIETNNKYEQLNPAEVSDLIRANPGITIIDVRPDSVFRGLAGDAKDRALGKMKNAINIPYASLSSSLDKIPREKPVLLIDGGGYDATRAATLLTNGGYDKVFTSFNGLDAWMQLPEDKQALKKEMITREIPYQTIDADAFNELAKKPVTIIDVRPAAEFENRSAQSWRNRGRIKNAINIPLDSLASAYQKIPTNKPIIVYAFSNSPEAYEAAALLASKGYPQVSVLVPGIWGLRYKAFNTPGKSYLNAWVVDIPEENF